MDRERQGGDAGAERARRKLRGLPARDLLLYEVTAGRELRVLRFPRRAVALSPRAGDGGRAFPTQGGGARPAA
jgi:hypothetical protein